MPIAFNDRPFPLSAIVFSEFHPTLGPSLTYQTPANTLTSAEFDLISPFLITPPTLAQRIIEVTTESHIVLSAPIQLTAAKYHRNSLSFNVAFLLPIDADVRPFRLALRKFAVSLTAFEVENEHVFDAHKRRALLSQLESIRRQLSSIGEANIRADEYNTLTLKLTPLTVKPPPVHRHDVPVIIRALPPNSTRNWDLAIRELLPMIDGVRHVQRISAITRLKLRVVKRAVQQLIFIDAATIIDIFQQNNEYETQTQSALLRRITSNPPTQSAAVDLCTNTSRRTHNDRGEYNRLVSLELARILESMKRGANISSLMLRHRAALIAYDVDMRRLVTFALLNGAIRRIHCFPTVIHQSQLYRHIHHDEALSDSTAAAVARMPASLIYYCNGEYHFDWICCAFRLSLSDVLAAVRLCSDIVLIKR